MLEGIRALGEAALKRAPLIKALVDLRPLEQLQEGERAYLVVLNINLSERRLRVEPQDLDEGALGEALWVGNAAGSNSPQDRLTTDHPEYLASQTVPNLLGALPEGSLSEKLRTLLKAVYVDLGEKGELFPEGGGDQQGGDRQYERYRRVWDLRRLLGLDPASARDLVPGRDREEAEGICDQEGVEFLSEGFLRAYARAKGSAKEAVKLVGRVLQNWVAKELEVKDSQIKLYTLALDGERLVRCHDYFEYIESELVEEAFKGQEAEEGVCHLCGASKRVTSNTTRFKLLKFYITDKPGFASRLHQRGFLRNYTLCRECYQALLAGERFVENELRTRPGRSNVYLIPVFHLPKDRPGHELEQLSAWADYLRSRLAASATLERWHEFQQQLERYRDYEERKALFVLNFLFATKGQAAVKVDKLIAEVPPSRLDQLDEVRNRVREWAAEHLGEDAHGEWDLGLEKLFYLLPLRQRDHRVEAKPYLELLDALLVGRPLSVQALIPQLLETAAIHRFERYEAHAHDRPSDPERALVLHLLQAQLFLRYLKELRQLHGLDEDEGGERRAMTMTETMAGQAAEIERELVDEGLRAWMDGVGLTGVRRGLFLLGVLIGKIGSTKKQRESGKPILNKVNFQRMDRLKVLRLANEVYEQLRQYKIADYNEGLYGAMKAHLDRGVSPDKDEDELGTPAENAYWVLAGYAYETQRAIRAGRLKRSQPAEAEAEEEPEAGGESREEG